MEKENWMSEFNKSDKEWREGVLNLTRLGVAFLGTKLSHLLVDLIFELYGEDDEKISKIFKRIRSSLEPYLGGDRLVVVDRIFALLETGEIGLSDRDESKLLKNKAHVQPVRFSLVTPKLRFAYETVYEVRDQVMFLEALVSLVLSEVVSSDTMNGYIKQCEAKLDKISQDMCDFLDRQSPSDDDDDDDSESDEDDYEEDPLQLLMTARIEELWTGFELYHKE